MILLKPVFIIAIVAVAMIGVMVPNVFATHDNDVGLLLPANWDLENYWTIEDIRGDRSYTSSGAYIEGFEKSYDRIDGYSFVGLSAAIYEVTEDVQDNWTAQDIASDERERYFGNGKMQAPIAFSDFKPFGFPSECKAIKIEYGDIYGNVKINSYCVKDQYHFSVIALGNVWDIDNDVIDFTKIILTNIDDHSPVASMPYQNPSSQENSAAATLQNYLDYLGISVFNMNQNTELKPYSQLSKYSDYEKGFSINYPSSLEISENYQSTLGGLGWVKFGNDPVMNIFHFSVYGYIPFTYTDDQSLMEQQLQYVSNLAEEQNITFAFFYFFNNF